MAFPYLLIGAFPKLIRFIPKPGAWMETFKHIMGFVLLGTVVYLLTTLHSPAHVIPVITLLFGLWGACWWIGRTPPTADGFTKIHRWLEAAIFTFIIVIIAYPGIDEVAPEHVEIGGNEIPSSFSGLYDIMDYRLERLVTRRLAEAGIEPTKETSVEEIVWIPFTHKGLNERLTKGQTVLVDFTADWCMTCKTLEANVLDTRAVREKLVEHNIATMQADCTSEDSDNSKILKELVVSGQVPVIAIFSPDKRENPEVLIGGYTSSGLLEAIENAMTPKQPDIR
jgi:thiol:disulfide interchange protein DsbD